jgi:hypothetical protein
MKKRELMEIIDAMSREDGKGMSPFEELTLLGLDESGSCAADKGWHCDEEYDFDENDERYRLLDTILKRNNDRRKYFA